ncbi:hypothetical protein IHE45_05G202500 [Dioscorea alata]|uniref:Uncharacterized protein n=1 Tax=Dioscorea alata TaxID=55571 RepID=A0ACB7W8H2_DIOAL|nr:hypothetical protein IHE45_05G202500 [Dioscorea alata]
MVFDESSDDLMKVGVFILVQALVYLILSSSSGLFSVAEVSSSISSKNIQCQKIRRIFLDVLSDLPPNGEPSPRSLSPVI